MADTPYTRTFVPAARAAAGTDRHLVDAVAIQLGLGSSAEDAMYVELLNADASQKRYGCLLVTREGVAYVEAAGMVRSGVFRRKVDTTMYSRFWPAASVVRAWVDPAEDSGAGYRLAYVAHLQLDTGEHLRFYCDVQRPDFQVFEATLRFIGHGEPWVDPLYQRAWVRADGLYVGIIKTAPKRLVMARTVDGIAIANASGNTLAELAADIRTKTFHTFTEDQQGTIRMQNYDVWGFQDGPTEWVFLQSDSDKANGNEIPPYEYVTMKFFHESTLASTRSRPSQTFLSRPERMPFIVDGALVLLRADEV